MTDNETELVAALEADIQIWESLVKYVEYSIVLSAKERKSGVDDTRGLREPIAERHALIEKVRSE